MEIQQMWNLKCTIIPVIIGATGIVKRSLRKNLETVPGKHSIDSLQKTGYTWNVTHIMESTAVWSLKPEQWGSPLVQEKYHAEKACDKRHPYHIILLLLLLLLLLIIIVKRQWSQKALHSRYPYDLSQQYVDIKHWTNGWQTRICSLKLRAF